MTYETILTETRGAVMLITLNRPQSLNALNSHVLEELIAAFAAFEADDSQRCAVLTGAGEKAFAAGADIKEMADKPAADFYAADFFSRWTSHLVKAVRKPWIAAVNGFALGGGCELAMMADFIIAAETAKFGQPEIKLGVAPGMGGSQRLTRAIGKAKAMEMCLTGRMMGAEEAERSGLVARVVPLASLVDEAVKTATDIAAMPPLAALANKEMVNAAFESTLDQGLVMERRIFQVLTATADKAEGMAAFIEKRPGGLDWALIFAIGLLAWGSLSIAETALQWRRSVEENLGWIDRSVLKLTGMDKLPPTWFDRFLNRFRLVRKAAYGLVMLLIGGVILLAKMGVL